MGSYSHGWVAKNGRIHTTGPGVCPDCGARLSVYRRAGETRCAPCIAALRSH